MPADGLNVPPPRAWQRMLSGRRLDLLDPAPCDIDILDIARGLARVARWNGQTTGSHTLSVAQHALIVDDIAEALQSDWPREAKLAALLHDAPEYVIGDLISPFKTAIGLDYKAFELRILSAIHRRFDLDEPLPEAHSATIKRADKIAAYFEATRLAGFGEAEADLYFGRPDGLPDMLLCRLMALEPMPTAEAEATFLARFQRLYDAPFHECRRALA